MAFEKKWAPTQRLTLLANGTVDGLIIVESTRGFYAKQDVLLLNNPSDATPLEIKAVLSKTQMIVGLRSTAYGVGADITAYLAGAQIYGELQSRPKIPENEFERGSFAEEPIVAKRVINVDEVGAYYGEDNPMPVAVLPSPSTSSIVFNEISSVPADIDVEIASFTVLEPKTKLYRVDVSGDNVATYWVTVNDQKIMTKRTYFGSELSAQFVFSITNQEYDLQFGDVVKVFGKHKRPFLGEFEASIIILVR